MEIVANINKQKQEIDRVDIYLVHTFVLHKHQIFPSVGGIPLIEEHLSRWEKHTKTVFQYFV